MPDARPARRRRLAAGVTAFAAVGSLVAALMVVGAGEERAREDPGAFEVDDGRFRLGADQVPSVFGLSVAQAVDLLEGRGLEVAVDSTFASAATECGESTGRAVDTRPAVGSLVEPGQRVTVLGTGGLGTPSAYCADPLVGRDLAWRFLGFATGSGPAPAFAEEVLVYADREVTTLSDEQAADHASWPWLDTLRREAAQVERWISPLRFDAPTLGTHSTRHGACGTDLPDLAGRRGLTLTVSSSADGAGTLHVCSAVVLYRDAEGAVDAVLVAGGHGDEPGHLWPPDVVGASAAEAERRLASAGLAVETVEITDCAPPGVVTDQWPDPTEEADPRDTGSVQVAVSARRGPCAASSLPQTPQGEAARALAAWARGAAAPAFADPVHLLRGDRPVTTLDAAAALDPAAWTCAGDPAGTCRSAPRLLATGPVSIARAADLPPPPGCLVRDDLPAGLDQDDAWRLSTPEPRTCADDWSVLVWADDAGTVTAVDVLLPRGR